MPKQELMRRHSPSSRWRQLLLVLAAAGCLSLGFVWAVNAPTASAGQVQTRTVSGQIVSVGDFGITLQTPGAPIHGVLHALSVAATRIQDEDLPYVWGGGHALVGVPSIGEPGGPGYNGKRKGYDCSGAVAAVLVAAGLWPRATWVPADYGVIDYLLRAGIIARGAGVGPHEVTLYDWSGVHIFMNINGRFWGTSDGGYGGDPKGGPGWLSDYPYDSYSGHFKRYHILPRLLQAPSSGRYDLGFQYPQSGYAALDGFGLGNQVKLTYTTTDRGTMVVKSVLALHSYTVSGTVQQVASGQSGAAPGQQLVELKDAAGEEIDFRAQDGQFPPLAAGDQIRLTYVQQTPFGAEQAQNVATAITVTQVSTPTQN